MIVGIAWFRAEQYEMLRALAADSDKMANTYEEWLANITKTMDHLRQNGMVVRRVDVEVTALVAWCEQRGIPLDGKARSIYAAEHVRSEDDDT